LKGNTRISTTVMPPVFFSENVLAITVKFTWVIHTCFAAVRLFFHKIIFIFDTLLPALSKMLHTSVVKFPHNCRRCMNYHYKVLIIAITVFEKNLEALLLYHPSQHSSGTGF
jgi:hypothetical protein